MPSLSMTHTGHILLETYVIEYGRSPAIMIFCLEPTFDLNLGCVGSNNCFRFSLLRMLKYQNES